MILQEIIDQINNLKKELDSLLPMSEENQKALNKKFRLEFNYNSNHIEGNTLTYGETELLLIFDETRGSHPHRDYEEMKASDATLAMITQLAKDKDQPLTESFIKNLNKILLVRPYWKEAITTDGRPTKREILIGDYKHFPNSVRLPNGEVFDYASPIETPSLMSDLINWLRNEETKQELHPIELAALLHYRFVRIHPFDDGNGRISRLLMNYILIKNDFPPVIIKSEDKRNYLSALHDADSGDISSFVSYIANRSIWSLDLSIRAAKNEKIEESEDWKKRAELLKKELSDNEEIKIVKSEAVVLDLINTKIIPLLFSTMAELTYFDDFFLNKIVLYRGIPLRKDSAIKRSSLVFGDHHINFNLLFEGFKKNIEDPFTVSVPLSFRFDKYKYEVELDETTVITKLYHHDFTKGETQELINKIGEFVVSAIEKRILDRLQ